MENFNLSLFLILLILYIIKNDTLKKKVSATSVSKQDTIAATIAPDIYIMNDF